MPFAPRKHTPRRFGNAEHGWYSRTAAAGRHLYNDWNWRDPKRGLRIRTIQRDCYLCQECQRQGRDTPVAGATAHVDHIIPHKGNEELFWDETNLETLCATCHNRKSAKEMHG